MKTLYLDCQMGAAGDMLTAALLELLPAQERQQFLYRMNHLNLRHVRVEAEPSVKCGIAGTHMRVRIRGEEEKSQDVAPGELGGPAPAPAQDAHGYHPHQNDYILSRMHLSDGVRDNARAVFQLIAQAESHAHNCPVDEVHFHEVGTLDAVVDIVAVCQLMELLGPERIVASPVHVGAGQVRCAHGVLPVPAPATAWILRDVPIYGGAIRGELCTPTGAALLRHFVDEFGPMPALRVERIGYGMGSKDFEAANCVRALLGQGGPAADGDTIACLSCNLDDMTGEEIGFAMERLLDKGALDVYTTPIGMKKCRPGVQLTCLCPEERAQEMGRWMLTYTTTLGVRQSTCRRQTLARQVRTVETGAGPVRVKSVAQPGLEREKIEYDDAARIARERDWPLRRAREWAAAQEK